jgi:hypothetical protein
VDLCPVVGMNTDRAARGIISEGFGEGVATEKLREFGVRVIVVRVPSGFAFGGGA